MIDVFISYSHCDRQFALQLVGALAQREYTTWFDKNDVFPAGEFREDIKAGIEEAGAFIFVLSPDSIISEECGKELNYAKECGKKLIPLLHRRIDPFQAPQALQELDWIEEASFDCMLEKVLDALLTDKNDWQQAGRWLRLSNVWDKNHKQNSGLLLHGKELKKAEDWLKKAERWRLEGSNKKPQPQPSHITFIRESRRAEKRFLLVSIVAILLLIGSMGGGIFWFLRPPDPRIVTNLADDGQGSLRWAIANAPAGSTITFDRSLWGQTIALTADLIIIKKNLSIRGPDANTLTISNRTHQIDVRSSASISIFDLTFTGSKSNSNSLLSNEGTLSLTSSTISGNTSSDDSVFISGGGISNSGKLTVTNSTVSGNTAQGDGEGGGILNGGTLTLINSTISGNTTPNSGGGISNGGALTLINSTISGNTAAGQCGNCVGNSDSSKFILTDFVISGNPASGTPGGGGGIANGNTLTLINSIVSDNTASAPDSGGGGISNSGKLTVTNSTVSGNTVSGLNSYGGGISNVGGEVNITFGTIYGNKATGGGGGLISNDISGHVAMRNSLVAGNHASTSPDIFGYLTSYGYNLIQDISGATFDPNNEHLTDISGGQFTDLRIDSKLSGSPPQTYALLPGSLAINKIPLDKCLIMGISTDQRGVKRPDGGETFCDIGAYESTE